jgi:putative FmdB family regulatory protein
MPIYEFYCADCNTIFNFFSGTVNTEKRPACPRCGRETLERFLSRFSTLRRGKGKESDEDDFPLPDMDESKMEQAMATLAQEADSVDEEDPRQAAQLMRKLSSMTGLNLGPAMEEALQRMESGEDPEQIEAEMGDLLEEVDPFTMGTKKGGTKRGGRPRVDDTLYIL